MVLTLALCVTVVAPTAAGAATPVMATPSAVTAQSVPAAAAGSFVAVTPSRILDTRDGTGVLTAGQAPGLDPVAVQVAGRGGVPVTGASAVVLNVTVTNVIGYGFITAYPNTAPRPVVSNLNFAPGQTVANLVTVAVGTDGKVALYNGGGGYPIDVLADVTGYYVGGAPTAAGAFVPLTPTRVLDTRGPVVRPTTAAVGALTTLPVQVTGQGGVPATGVSAVVMNVTVTDTTGVGFVTAYPNTAARPTVSNLNFAPEQTLANLVTVPVGGDGKVALFNGATTTPVDLLVDVAGYYLGGTPTVAGTFVSLAPDRVLDTRNGTGAPTAAIPAGTVLPVQVTGQGGVPTTGVGAVVMNVTATDTHGVGFVTAYPSTASRPLASNLNFASGVTVPNLVTVPVGADGKVALFNGAATSAVDLLADVAGYYLAATPSTVGGGPAVGTVAAWGGGVLGDGAGNDHSGNEPLGTGSRAPVPISALTGVTAIAGNGPANYAVTRDGHALAWGDNTWGQLGDGTKTMSTAPAPVSGLTGVTAVAAGADDGYALTGDGRVWAWGRNTRGALGDGTLNDSSIPVQVSGLSGVIAIAGGWLTAEALTSDGHVWAWGGGSLGNGSFVEDSNVPVQVGGLNGITAIAANSTGTQYALTRDGHIWAWGSGGDGQLGTGVPGTGPFYDVSSPVQVSGLTGVTAIGAGTFDGYALTSDGHVWDWGYNGTEELGTGIKPDPRSSSLYDSDIPLRVPGLTGVTAIAEQGSDEYALTSDGHIWTWGPSSLGPGTIGTRASSPVLFSSIPGVTAIAGVQGYGDVFAFIRP
jgi:alpha-tubulin suppressor-like RCC1 family protein